MYYRFDKRLWLILLCTSPVDESKVRQQQQEMEQGCVAVKLAVAGKEKAEENSQQIQAQLEESNVSLERLRCELLRQQEHSEQGETKSCSWTAQLPFQRGPWDTLTIPLDL